jgi:hypothetical protein
MELPNVADFPVAKCCGVARGEFGHIG